MDIDIDIPPTLKIDSIFPNWVRASIFKEGKLTAHPCGRYPQHIPEDYITGLSAMPYDKAEEFGYTKIDFLNLNIYTHFQSRAEIEELLQIEPDWNLLLIPSCQTKLFQLANHGDMLDIIKPKSIEQLADVLALIRPGKSQLAKTYKVNRDATRRILYSKDKDGYSFKKSHAICYAMVVVLQLHLIGAGVI